VVRYNVKASIRQIETWDEVKLGYIKLFEYLCFVVLFIVILGMQLNVGRAFTVDYVLREVLFEQTEKLDAIRTMVQVVLATQQYSSNFFLMACFRCVTCFSESRSRQSFVCVN
jgi:hypothetical protein